MPAEKKTKSASLDFSHIEMLISFADASFEFPKLSFEQVAKKLAVDFSKIKNGKIWERECRMVFGRERNVNRP
jgi:hypothetical protein